MDAWKQEYSGRWKVVASGAAWRRRGFGGCGFLALARRLGFGGQNVSTTAAQQGAAPDRPQCCRFSGFPALLIVGRDWRAAGELSVVLRRAAWMRVILFL